MGRAIARRFALAGDRVAIVGRRKEILTSTARDINEEVGADHVIAVVADLTNPEQVNRVASALDGDIDAIVNCAGGVASRGTDEKTLEGIAHAWRQDFDSNVLTAVLLVASLESRLTRPGGRVLLISSIAALRGGGGSYSGAKAALHGWCFDLAAQLGPSGITVNIIAPGYVAGTEFFASTMTSARHDRLVGQTLVGRAGLPEDVASAAMYLASDEASYVTGQVLQVNGGALYGR